MNVRVGTVDGPENGVLRVEVLPIFFIGIVPVRDIQPIEVGDELGDAGDVSDSSVEAVIHNSNIQIFVFRQILVRVDC